MDIHVSSGNANTVYAHSRTVLWFSDTAIAERTEPQGNDPIVTAPRKSNSVGNCIAIQQPKP